MHIIHHAGFNDGTSEGGSSRWHQAAWGSPKKSFKDKLVGEIPGAFAKAFDFTDLMEMKLNQTMKCWIYVKV